MFLPQHASLTRTQDYFGGYRHVQYLDCGDVARVYAWTHAPCVCPNAAWCIQAHLVLVNFAILHFIDIVFFTKWRSVSTCIEQIYWCHCPNSICSLHDSVSHFNLSHKNSNSWPLMILLHWRLRCWLAFFSNKVFFN